MDILHLLSDSPSESGLQAYICPNTALTVKSDVEAFPCCDTGRIVRELCSKRKGIGERDGRADCDLIKNDAFRFQRLLEELIRSHQDSQVGL